MIGIGSLVGSAGARDADTEMVDCPPGQYCDFRLAITVEMIESNHVWGDDSLCEDLAEGCAVYTAASVANMIPGDEQFVAATCAGGVLSCEIYDEYKEWHGDQNADIYQANESGGEVDKNDYIVVPADWD